MIFSIDLEQLTPSQLEWIDDFSTSSLFLPRTITMCQNGLITSSPSQLEWIDDFFNFFSFSTWTSHLEWIDDFFNHFSLST